MNTASLNKEILKLSIPAIISNVTVPLLGLSDTAISGHLGSASYLAAIAVGTLMLNVLTWLMGFLRMGTTGLVARAFGAKNPRKIAATLTMSLTCGIGMALLVILLQTPLLNLMNAIIDSESEVERLASLYFRVCVWGLPAVLCNMAFTGWFIGRQTTLWPMIIAVSSNIINIALSFLLAFPLGMGFIGVAIGTLTANWAGMLIAIIAAVKTTDSGQLILSLKKAYKEVGLRNFFGVNSDLFLRSACVMGVSMSVTAIGARLGETTLAVNAVMMQFFTFFSFFMDGFAFSGEALCGKYSGAGNIEMLYKSVKALLWWSAGIMIAFTLLYLLGWLDVTNILTDVENVRKGVAEYHIWVILIPAATVAAFIFDGFYIGLTRTRKMLYVTFVAAIIFSLVALTEIKDGHIMFGVIDNNRLWLAFLSYLLIRGLGLGAMLPKILRQTSLPSTQHPYTR